MKKCLSFLVAMMLLVGFSSQARAGGNDAKLDAAMKMLQGKVGALGAPSLSNDVLKFGTTKINGNFDIVDEVGKANECVSTIFMKKGTDFERVATNIVKEGKRAIGTKLALESPAFTPSTKGEPFKGPADILGKKYDTFYSPIKDASGAVIGIYIVGVKID